MHAEKHSHFCRGLSVLLIKITEFFMKGGVQKRQESGNKTLFSLFRKHLIPESIKPGLKRLLNPISLARKGRSFFCKHQGDTVIDELSNNSFGPGNLKNSSAWSFRIYE